MPNSEAARDASQYLTFHIDGEECAVGILRVKEIIQFEAVTRVPGTPAWIRGVMNLRGSVVPVIDLAAKFGGGLSSVTRTTCIVIVEVALDGRDAIMGVLADSVSQVVELAVADVQPPPAFGTRIRVDYLSGMACIGKQFALILDIDRLLSADELVLAAGAPAAEPAAGVERPASAAAPA